MEHSIDIGQLSLIGHDNVDAYSQLGEDYLFTSFRADDMRGMRALEAPIRFDGMTMVILRQGHLRFEINLVECEARVGDLIFFPPQSIIKVDPVQGEGLEAEVLFVSSPFLKNINVDLRIFRPTAQLRALRPVFDLEGTPGRIVKTFFELLHLHATVGRHDSSIDRNIASNIIAALIYQVYGMALNSVDMQAPETAGVARSRQSQYVIEFIRLVQDHFHTERSVGFYARRLFVSPKHLSMVIKAQTGHSPSSIIEQYVLTEAKSLLMYSGKSVQQVAYELNFATQSSFGKFFKHLTGVSPRDYQKS